ncbi:hypothetical protein ACFL2I_04665 [Candidatus Omnitrophota bacterium]
MMEKKRSLGVVFVGVINLVLGGYCSFPFGSNVINSILHFSSWGDTPKKIIFLTYLVHCDSFIVSLLYAITGYGLLKTKEWARKGTVFLGIYFIVGGAIIYLLQAIWLDLSFPVLHLIKIIYPLFLIIYLTRPKVKALFSPERSEGAV